jgi:hypothetical protein
MIGAIHRVPSNFTRLTDWPQRRVGAAAKNTYATIEPLHAAVTRGWP